MTVIWLKASASASTVQLICVASAKLNVTGPGLVWLNVVQCRRVNGLGLNGWAEAVKCGSLGSNAAVSGLGWLAGCVLGLLWLMAAASSCHVTHQYFDLPCAQALNSRCSLTWLSLF
jgi:hypothetical protein